MQQSSEVSIKVPHLDTLRTRQVVKERSRGNAKCNEKQLTFFWIRTEARFGGMAECFDNYSALAKQQGFSEMQQRHHFELCRPL